MKWKGMLCLCSLAMAMASICSDFFTILSLSSSSPFQEKTCSFLPNYSSYFSLLSSQMIALNSSVTILLPQDPASHCQHSFTPTPSSSLTSYQRLSFRAINPSELFQEYHLTADHYDPTSARDILKLLIAHKYRSTYIELGIHFLSTDPEDFTEQMFVALQIWSHNKCSQQISNLAFCLSRDALEDLIREAQEPSSSAAPLDYGTALFTQILPNRYPLRLLSLNHPEIFTLPEILSDYQDYHHKFLYLPLSLASLAASSNYRSYVDNLRSELGFPPLHSSPPTLLDISSSLS